MNVSRKSSSFIPATISDSDDLPALRSKTKLNLDLVALSMTALRGEIERMISEVNVTALGRSVTLTGDVTGSGSGSFPTTIANLAVTDAKVNDVAWGKITGTPTTLAGYGINNAYTTAETDALIIAYAQPLDADLTAIAALSTEGYLARVAPNTWSLNPTIPWSAISSTPTTLADYGITDAQALDADLTAIAALTGTGYAARIADNTWALNTSIPWSSISSTPTTLSGYGITDAVDGSGAENKIAWWSDANTLSSSAALGWDGTTLSITGNESISGTIDISGLQTNANDIVFSGATGSIKMDADTKALFLLGGPTSSAADGSSIRLYGDSHASQPGNIELVGGTGASGDILVYTNNSLRYTIAKDGTHTFATPITALSGVLFNGGTFVAGKIYSDATNGLVIAGKAGASGDMVLVNRSGGEYMRGGAGTTAVTFPGAVSMSSTLGLLGPLNIGQAGVSNAVINTPVSMYFNIDSDANATGEIFAWGHNAAITGHTRLMTLWDSGNLRIGSTNTDPAVSLQVDGNIRIPDDSFIYFGGSGASGNSAAIWYDSGEAESLTLDATDTSVTGSLVIGDELILNGNASFSDSAYSFNIMKVDALLGTGTRLVTSTAAGTLGNATTIAGNYTFSGSFSPASISVSGISTLSGRVNINGAVDTADAVTKLNVIGNVSTSSGFFNSYGVGSPAIDNAASGPVEYLAMGHQFGSARIVVVHAYGGTARDLEFYLGVGLVHTMHAAGGQTVSNGTFGFGLNGRFKTPVISSAPSSPADGEIYYDSTAHHFYGRVNGSWVQLDN